MAKAREVPGLGPDVAFREAAGRAVEVRAQEVFDHAEGVLDTQDIERVHDMRVATRRLRAVMEIFAPCFPKDRYKDLLREVKGLADTLGARRDADVAIVELEAIAAELPAVDRAGIESLVSHLRDHQRAANQGLERALEEVESAALRERLLELAASPVAP